MYPVRIVLLHGTSGADHAYRGAAVLRTSLELSVSAVDVNVQHVRTRVLPGRIEAIAFVAAPSLNEAESLCGTASRALTQDGRPLAGWQVTTCHADFALIAGWLTRHDIQEE
ncbi:MAG: hypothetical protein QOF58_4506 [Pseudonocardiales bacterium]|jgi:hypothetical protein|nr:hypothetical protein [Pseudonocardiales bacterium]